MTQVGDRQAPSPGPIWQVVVGASPRMPRLASLAGRSLRAPVLWTAAATCTDLAMAYATATPASMATAELRAAFAGFSLVAGLIAGRRRGLASMLVLVGTLALSLFEGMSLWGALRQVLASPHLLRGMLPNAIPQALTIYAALTTAITSVRRT
jgi:hypothetical protein